MSVILLEKNLNVINSITQLLHEHDIELHCATGSVDLFNLISSNNDIDLIITEINLKKENGLDIIRKLKNRGIQIPVMILTSLSKRDVFFESIRAGAVDYVVKPFNPNFLFERISNYIGGLTPSGRSMSINFYKYLNGEISKAMKGHYDVSIFMSALHIPSERSTEKMNGSYIELIDQLYPEIKLKFFETDILIKFGLQSIIGVLPFCNKQDTEIVAKKIQDFFEIFKQKHIKYEKCKLDSIFLTFPSEIKSENDIISQLTTNMQELLGNKY